MASEIEAAAERVDRHRQGENVYRIYVPEAYDEHGRLRHGFAVEDEMLRRSRMDAQILADAYLARLSADRAEREERARPIDAEWLESIGAVWFGDYLGFDLPHSARLEVMRDYGAMTVECGLRPKHTGGRAQINPLRNRGDVLDMLRVLKGGV